MKALCGLFLFGVALGFVSACSLSGPLRVDQKATNYKFKTPASPWISLQDKADADEAWMHRATGATMSLRSLCHRYEHIPLKILNQNVLSLVNNAEVISQSEIRLDKRAALDTSFVGELDGVRVATRHVVLKKNHCIFDFTLSQVARIDPAHQQQFETLLQSFQFEGGSKGP
jgi:hypothetical protein